MILWLIMNIIHENKELNNCANAYSAHDADTLREQLSDTDKRMKFGEWLLDHFSPDMAIDTDFEWHSKVITLLCKKAREDSTLTADDKRNEDLLIAGLISKADPLPLKNQAFKDRFFNQMTRLVNNSAGMMLNSEQINSELKEANLPSTRMVLIRRMLEIQDINTLIHKAFMQNDPSMIKTLAEQKPQQFKSALTCQNKNGDTPVALSAFNGQTEILTLMAKAAPAEFGAALIVQNQHGSTPVSFATSMGHTEILTLMAKTAPIEFRAALNMLNNHGDKPTLLAANKGDMGMLKLMVETAAPEAIALINKAEESILDRLKMQRPPNFKEITRLFKNSDLHRLNKELVRRKALSHAWDLSGVTSIVAADTGKVLKTATLEGHFPPEWCHMLGKDLDQFRQSYPDLLTEPEAALLKDVLDIGANIKSFSLEDKLARIKKGLPTIINAGFNGHAVTLLIWGDRFVICNRGGESRRPLEIYHFNAEQLDLNDLREIIKTTASGTNEDYKKLFFKTLPEKLVFTQDELDKELENAGLLFPDQTAGNCSLANLIPIIYVLRLFTRIGKIQQGSPFGSTLNHSQEAASAVNPSQKENAELETSDEEFFSIECTSDEETPDLVFLSFETSSDEESSDVELLEDSFDEESSEVELLEDSFNEERIKIIDHETIMKIKEEEALWYQTWLLFEQLTILGRNIKPLENGTPYFETDHQIIQDSLGKAHLLKLDALCQQKLKDFNEIYLKFASKTEIAL